MRARIAPAAFALTTCWLFVSVAGAQDADAGLPAPDVVSSAQPAAATPAPEPDAEDAAPPGPTPEQAALLESTHVAELAQQTRVDVRAARPLLRGDSDVLRIARALPGREAELARLTSGARMEQIARMSQRELSDLRAEWRAIRDQLTEWQDQLSERSTEVEGAHSHLVELRRTWRALRDAVAATGDPNDPRVPRITASLDEVRSLVRDLDREREIVQGLEDRVSVLQLTADDVNDDLRAALDAYRERLHVRDRPPLWQGLGEDQLDDDEPAWSAHLAAQARLLSEQAPGVLRLAIAWVVLALCLAWARRRVRGWEGASDLGRWKRAVERPVVASLLLVLFASRVFVPHAPVVFGDVVSVLILLPLALSMDLVLPASSRPAVALVAAYVLVDRVEGTLADGLAARRALILVESIVLAVALAAWAWRAPAEEGVLRWLRRLALAAALTLAAAVVANVLGYAFLATVLVRGTAIALEGTLSLTVVGASIDALARLALHGDLLSRSHGVRLHRTLIESRLERGIVVAFVLAWVALVLGAYGLASPFFGWLEDVLHAHRTFGTLDLTLGEISAAAIVLAISWVLTRFVLFVLELDVLPRLALEAGVGGAIAGLTRYVLFGTGILLTLATLGIDADQIALVAGALGVGVGFGLQGIVANFIAGLVLMIERPVRLGDRIEIGALAGKVQRIGLRSSTVRGDDGSEVIVPNEKLMNSEVVNWTFSDRRNRVQIPVGVGYGSDTTKVLEILTSTVRGHAEVLTAAHGAGDPAVLFTGFGASSLDFVVRFWTEQDQSARVKSEVGLRILEALAAANVEIPFPQQDVRVVSLPEPQAAAATEAHAKKA
ncbi:MAG: mechanosensitive ion channel [Sandaracinus sp.]